MIGKVPGKNNVWIATGFSGSGLTWGTAAGGLLARQINGESVPLEEDLSPSRFGVLGLATMAAEQMTTAVNLAERILPASAINPHELKPGEGKVGMVDGVHTAICRDETGCEHRLSPVCTHMGGVVHWNAAARTWDCPVHGGRFTADGQRLYGPPENPLEAVSPKAVHVKISEE
jgi:nitrite reductase/ring-hydroxylating ferredoxin subunit